MQSSRPLVSLGPFIAIENSSLDLVEDAIDRHRQGRESRGYRPSARYLLASEARAIVQSEISRKFEFDASQVSGYISLFPDMLDIAVSKGSLRDAIESAVKRELEDYVMGSVFGMLISQRQDHGLDVIAEDIAQMQREYLPSITGASDRYIAALLEKCLEERDVPALTDLRDELDRGAKSLADTARRLDIADPPTRDLAKRAMRVLQEASDVIDLAIQFENVEEFLSPRPTVSP